MNTELSIVAIDPETASRDEIEARIFANGEAAKSFDEDSIRLLDAIHKRKLYQTTHDTFALYLKEKWKISKTKAYTYMRLIEKCPTAGQISQRKKRTKKATKPVQEGVYRDESKPDPIAQVQKLAATPLSSVVPYDAKPCSCSGLNAALEAYWAKRNKGIGGKPTEQEKIMFQEIKGVVQEIKKLASSNCL